MTLKLYFIIFNDKQKDAKINKWYSSKLRTSAYPRKLVTRRKRNPTDFENIFAHKSSDKVLVSRIWKALLGFLQ